ncbi:MAG: hypothetical protein QM788_13420 [Roseateles sp.]|uniref:hypothetical protein n=1 Tax=Roseateles sp. TaxID=1971397 RepID=UPI0039E744F2
MSAAPMPLAAVSPAVRPVIRPFTWLTEAQQQAPHACHLALIADARDVAAGAAAIAALLEQDWLDRDCDDEAGNPVPPLMADDMRGGLQRLAVVCLQHLADRLADALGGADVGEPMPACPTAPVGLDELIPAAPCAGMMLTTEEAAGLAELRQKLQAAGGAA